MFLYGGGGHAKVIIDILEDRNVNIDGVFDDNPELEDVLGYPVYKTGSVTGPLIISVGNNGVRKKIAEAHDVEYLKAQHTSSVVSPKASIGPGTVIMQGAVVQSCADIGRHVIINTGASVDHDCKIGDYVHVSPNAALCGNVRVGEGSWIGAGAVVIPGVKIGKWSVIAAGSVVTKDIPDYVLAAGNRCKVIKSIK